MIQKPEQKNGQKHVTDTSSKTSSVELQQQQRKAGRTNNVSDVAKQSSGPGAKGSGGFHQPAGHGVANGHVENGRGHSANSIAPVHAAPNGNQVRSNGNTSTKPDQSAYGKPAARPQSNGAGYQPGVQSNAPNHGVQFNSGVARSTKGPLGTPATAVSAPAAGGRGREQGGAPSAHPSGGVAAAGNGTANGDAPPGAAGAHTREPRRRGGRGRGGADIYANGTGADRASGDGAAADDASERPDRSGRPRGGRRQRGPAGEPAGDSAPGESGGTKGSAGDDQDGAARPDNVVGQSAGGVGGLRNGRPPRGRRGRGGQQAGAADEGEQRGEGGERPQRPPLAPRAKIPQPLGDAGTQAPDQKPRQQRQRPPKEPRHVPGQQPAAERDGLAQPGSRDQSLPGSDAQQQASGAKPPRQRRGKESRPSLQDGQTPVAKTPTCAEAIGQLAQEGHSGIARGQGRSGRRRNSPSADGSAAGTLPGTVADNGENANAAPHGARPPRPRPPRQQQQQPVEQVLLDQPAVEQPYAAPTASQPAAAPAVPQVQPQPSPQQHLPLPPPQQQQILVQQHYQPPLSFQEGPGPGVPLQADFPQSMLPHMVPSQHPYQLQHEHQFQQQQQHYMQQHHLQPPPPPQFDQAFQHFHHQQMLQQHLQQGPGGHSFLPGGYNAPGGSMPPPPHMPPFYPGGNPYGQLLGPPPPPPAFASSPAPPMPEGAVPSAAPVHQHVSGLDSPAMEQSPPAYVQQPSASVQQQQPQVPEQSQQLAIAEQQQPAPASDALSETAVMSAAPAESVPAAPERPEPVAEVPAAEPVKNEWAERLAQQALARMNAVKSSLISGASSEGLIDERSRSTSRSYANGSAPSSAFYNTSPRGPPSASGGSAYGAEPESWRTVGADGWRNGAASGAPPSDATNGWRASLAPTGVADAADAWRTRNGGVEEVEPKPAAPYQPPRREESPPPPPSSTTSAAGARPRLNLQPRTKPLPVPQAPAPAANGSTDVLAATGGSATAVSSGAAANGSRSSIFGAARPREEVLRERGITEPERLNSGNMAYANGGSSGPTVTAAAGRVGGRAGSVTSGASDEDQWQTVGKGGRSKPPPSSDVGNALLDATSDPFFTGRQTTGHGVAIVGRSIPAGRVFSNGSGAYGGGSFGKGSYGSDTYMNAYGASRGHGNAHGNEDDEPIFKRGLPTRNDGPF